MSLTVYLGTFTFPSGEPTVTQRREYVYDQNGDTSRERVTTDIEGKYSGSSSAAYEAQMLAFRGAMDQDQASFVVSYGGTNVVDHLSVGGSLCLVGPRCTGYSFPDGAGAELASGGIRTYRATIEWEREVGSHGRGDLVEFRESITYTRGDPIYKYVNVMNGSACVFLVCGTPAYEATQSGEAVGRTTYPSPADPLWPSACIHKAPYRRDSPEVVRLNSSGSLSTARLYRISWDYTFASGTDFAGTSPSVHSWGTQLTGAA